MGAMHAALAPPRRGEAEVVLVDLAELGGRVFGVARVNDDVVIGAERVHADEAGAEDRATGELEVGAPVVVGVHTTAALAGVDRVRLGDSVLVPIVHEQAELVTVLLGAGQTHEGPLGGGQVVVGRPGAIAAHVGVRRELLRDRRVAVVPGAVERATVALHQAQVVDHFLEHPLVAPTGERACLDSGSRQRGECSRHAAEVDAGDVDVGPANRGMGTGAIRRAGEAYADALGDRVAVAVPALGRSLVDGRHTHGSGAGHSEVDHARHGLGVGRDRPARVVRLGPSVRERGAMRVVGARGERREVAIDDVQPDVHAGRLREGRSAGHRVVHSAASVDEAAVQVPHVLFDGRDLQDLHLLGRPLPGVVRRHPVVDEHPVGAEGEPTGAGVADLHADVDRALGVDHRYAERAADVPQRVAAVTTDVVALVVVRPVKVRIPRDCISAASSVTNIRL